MEPLARQVGIIVYINGEYSCLDSFQQPETLHKLFPKLVRSYAMESLKEKKGPIGGRIAPNDILIELKEARFHSYNSPGQGTDLRLQTPKFLGSCLVDDHKVLHLSLFLRKENEQRNKSMSNPRRRSSPRGS